MHEIDMIKVHALLLMKQIIFLEDNKTHCLMENCSA